MLDIDTAIKHCLDIADGQDKCAEISVSEHAKERISQCAADHRQLVEWLTELKEAKRLLKSARSIIEDVICNEDYLCNECEYRAKCDGGFSFYWRYADEALALIGEDGDTNG